MRRRYKSLEHLDKKWRFFIIFVVLAVIMGALAFISQIFADELFGWKSTVIREEHNLPFKAYLEINVTNIPLNITVYDGDDIRIKYINETELIIEENEYCYFISQDPDFAFTLFAKDQLYYGLEILLPDEVYRSISISTASGNIDYSLSYAENIYITSRSGKVNASGLVGDVTIKTSNADIYADFTYFTKDCELQSDSGNIYVKMTEQCEPMLDFYADNGKISTDFFGENIKNKAVSEERLILKRGNGTKTLFIYTGTGNLQISEVE